MELTPKQLQTIKNILKVDVLTPEQIKRYTKARMISKNYGASKEEDLRFTCQDWTR